MSRGGHNWKGGGTVEGTRSLDVMKLARAGLLSGLHTGVWQWTQGDDTAATISIRGGRQQISLSYRTKSHGGEWQSVEQPVPIRWTPCRFGGERPWFVCDVRANGMYCGRRVAKLYGGDRLFACRHCFGSAIMSSASGQWIRRTITLRVCIVSLALIMMGQRCRLRRNQNGCAGRRTRTSCSRSRQARRSWTLYSPLAHSIFSPK